MEMPQARMPNVSSQVSSTMDNNAPNLKIPGNTEVNEPIIDCCHVVNPVVHDDFTALLPNDSNATAQGSQRWMLQARLNRMTNK
ncbi:hypothetical protein PIB30_009448 [Stylosanthes scabra]|uniref:Uncharacterized protein n=1 Tax=Stylosanthes scabra TaxID=79078 RepID=A0ABU6X595_9FABA|nr:hypothetical protein [Stylosanthes scabra]